MTEATRLPSSILCQRLSNQSTEARTVRQAGLMLDLPVQMVGIEQLVDQPAVFKGMLVSGALPVGSVEFLRTAMEVAGIREPESMSYPPALRPFLGRWLQSMPVGQVQGTWFVKPIQTKLFTGFMWHASRGQTAHEDLQLYGEHDAEQLRVLQSLPLDTEIWVAEPVNFLCEWRYYVLDHQVIGAARYDADGLDAAPAPDIHVLNAAIAAMQRTGDDAPVAYALDLGVLSTGQTVLVEANDAWALGLYGGGPAPRHYVELLTARWRQLLLCGICEMA
ncbi:ATP-grasp domain-containing protein [Pelomonas sp. APW6]|uniref:ATP-grasp domain-containing protein n=1 Tax=Roseateles subflavus TaxID=3053353 RepID=A0ABT7LNG6_9BURK|nr:ATP-grasp domain-containing protein [Pelomonas sp. APW6]MDL5034414.1 ATP-grasp domain-containing protein [Pelomonas sp. APW6]